MATQLWAISLVVIACVIGSFGPIFLKKGSGEFKLKIKTLFNKYLIIGLFFYVVSTILFIPALKGGELSVLYPLVATVYIWVTLWSSILLKEKINKYKIIGIVLIILGVGFIGIGGSI